MTCRQFVFHYIMVGAALGFCVQPFIWRWRQWRKREWRPWQEESSE